ncbi:MAG: hypothetical protein HY788_12660 [Deltaproteobacteria bacterium]|nr:hypothetical protein [Deltaproteobacteria bacterium]
MENVKGFSDYVAVFRRRIHWIVWPAVLLILVGSAVATLLPNIYKSEAVILIEGQQITEALVPTTVTTYADQRIQAIAQQVMSRSKILELVRKFDLYASEREKMPTDTLVDKVKESITITPISAEIKTVRSNAPSDLTIAFSLAFEGENPQTVQRVTSELASFFLSSNIEARKDSAKGTAEFLEKQVEVTKVETQKLEEDISRFKQQHLEELPEFMTLNIQNLESINNGINNVTREIVSLEEQTVNLKNQLASLDPFLGSSTSRVLTDNEQLQQLELKRAQLRSKYSDKHPALQALENEIEILKSTTGQHQDLTQKKARLQQLEHDLAQLKAKYSGKHPAVLKSSAELEALQQEVAAAEQPSSTQTANSEPTLNEATNPAYVSLKSEVEKAQVRLKFLRKEKERLIEERDQTQKKLRTMPGVEKQYRELTTDYETVRTRLSQLEQKYQVAKIAEGMEEGQLAEKFTMIEPPYLPEEPYKPNRPAILLISLVLGSGFGIGMGSIKEFSDHAIRTPEEVERITGTTVLTIIPNILSPGDKRRRRLKAVSAVILIVGVPVLGLAAIHFLYMDLYVFYYKVLRFLSERYFLSF